MESTSLFGGVSSNPTAATSVAPQHRPRQRFTITMNQVIDKNRGTSKTANQITIHQIINKYTQLDNQYRYIYI
jgi:hypothetical protein